MRFSTTSPEKDFDPRKLGGSYGVGVPSPVKLTDALGKSLEESRVPRMLWSRPVISAKNQPLAGPISRPVGEPEQHSVAR